MAGEVLLINPRRRARRAPKLGRDSSGRFLPAGRSRNPVQPLRAAAKRRRRNPIRTVTVAPAPARRAAPARRRRNPIRTANVQTYSRKRRRNPLALGGIGRGLIGQLRDAAIGGAGAVAVELAMGQVQGYLPEILRRKPGQVGLGDVVKVGLTIALGRVLSRPTRGLSQKMAAGALIVQAADLIRGFVASAGMPLGYATAGMVANGAQRVSPNNVRQIGLYTKPGATQLLNRYTQPGATQLLNQSTARSRESVSAWR